MTGDINRQKGMRRLFFDGEHWLRYERYRLFATVEFPLVCAGGTLRA
jgi:hypothetical protein